MSPPFERMVLTMDETVELLIGCVPSHVAAQPPPERTKEIMYDFRPVALMYCWMGIGLLKGMIYSARCRSTVPGGEVGPGVGVGPAVGVGPHAVGRPQGAPLPAPPLFVQGSLP